MVSNINPFAYKTGGLCWSWGGNSYGQIGNGTTTSYSSPVQVVGNHSFIMIESGLNSSIGLKQNGQLWCWGGNDYGQLGTNNATGYSSPVQTVGNHSFLYATAAFRSTFAIKDDGTCWAWGNNQAAALGTGNYTNYSSPVQVIGNHSFVMIKAGGITAINYAAGLKPNRILWGWGQNGFGQLGNGNVTTQTSPVSVVGSHSFIDFALGAYSTYGLKEDGSVWGWGCNSYGELGNGNRTSYSSPVQVVGNHSFVSITASVNNAAAALKADGSVWCWGNGAGIGNNTINSYSSPVQVVGNHSFIQVRSIGGPGFIALKENGSVWTWGSNTDGRLGDNTVTTRSSPVQVVGAHSFITTHTGLDMHVNISSQWLKRPIMFMKQNGTWERVVSNLVCNSQQWKHGSRELR